MLSLLERERVEEGLVSRGTGEAWRAEISQYCSHSCAVLDHQESFPTRGVQEGCVGEGREFLRCRNIEP